MEPSDFLSREEFEALSEEEQLDYAEELSRALHEADTLDETLRIAAHYFFEVAEWVLGSKEVEQRVRRPLWDAYYNDAAQIASVAAKALESGDLPPDQRAAAARVFEDAQRVAEHKRDLENL